MGIKESESTMSSMCENHLEHEVRITTLENQRSSDHKSINALIECVKEIPQQFREVKDEIVKVGTKVEVIDNKFGSHIEEGNFWRKVIVGIIITIILSSGGVIWGASAFHTSMQQFKADFNKLTKERDRNEIRRSTRTFSSNNISDSLYS